MWSLKPLCNSAEDLGTLAEKEPPTGYEPKEYHITEAYVDYTQESTGEQRSPNDFDHDDVTIGKMLSDACRRRADHSEEGGLSSCLSSSVSHERTGRPVVCSLGFTSFERPINSETQLRFGLSWNDKESRFSLTVKQRFENTNSRLDYDRRSIQKCNETIESQKEEIRRSQQGERLRQDHQLLHEQLLKQNLDLREAHNKSLSEMEELKRFQGSTFDTIARRKLVED